ncbi:hypothetical protein ABPG72_015190 [Tetrahymena utriculariae]
MKVIKCMLFLLFIHTKVLKATVINLSSGQAQIVKGYANTPCDPSQNLEQQQFQYYGLNLLPIQDFPFISRFTIAGWFLFRQNYAQEYDILTVFENLSTFLFKIQYNFLSQQIKSTLFTSSQVFSQNSPFFSFSLQNWYFCQFTLQYSQQPLQQQQGGRMYLDSYICLTQTQYLSSSQQSPRNNLFQSNCLVFNLGNSQGGTNATPQIHPSYSVLKQVYLFWNTNAQSLFQLNYDLASNDIFLFWSYGFEQTQQNKGYLIGDIAPGNKLPLSIVLASSFQIKNNQFISTDYINCSDQNGFVISFHFKFDASSNLSGNKIYLIKFVQLQNLKTLMCQKCNPYCLTCKTYSDNCTSCLYPDQAPPRCNCILKNMFLDTNHVCQFCSYKCISCEFQSDFCIQCGYNKVAPPLCNCNSQYQEINQTCQPLSCDNK